MRMTCNHDNLVRFRVGAPTVLTTLPIRIASQGKSCSGVGSCKYSFLFRGVAERSNAAVLKTVLLKGNGGSNPSSSAIVTIRKNDGTDAKYEMETFETQ